MRIDLEISQFEHSKSHPNKLHETAIAIIAIVVAAVKGVVAAVAAAAGVSIALMEIGFGIAGMLVSMGMNQGFARMAANAERDKMRRARRHRGGAAGEIFSGQQINGRQSNDPVRVIYGIAKTGGIWVYNKSSSYDNEILNTIVTWGEGEIEGVHTAIDMIPLFGGTGTHLNDLRTGGEFVY